WRDISGDPCGWSNPATCAAWRVRGAYWHRRDVRTDVHRLQSVDAVSGRFDDLDGLSAEQSRGVQLEHLRVVELDVDVRAHRDEHPRWAHRRLDDHCPLDAEGQCRRVERGC